MLRLSLGPWEYDSTAGGVYDARKRLIVDVAYATDYDCRLIAAAPEMLQILRDAVDCEGRDELSVVLAAARRLIARLGNG